MTAYELTVTVVTGVAVLVGVAGTLLPVLPGLLLVWAAVVAYGMFVGFGVVGWISVIVATALTALGLYLNFRIPQRAASSTGLSVAAQLLGLALAVAGFFLVPVVGFPLGFVLGVFLIRLRSTGERHEAWKSTKSIIGSLLRASAVQAGCAIAIMFVWMGWAATVTLA